MGASRRPKNGWKLSYWVDSESALKLTCIFAELADEYAI